MAAWTRSYPDVFLSAAYSLSRLFWFEAPSDPLLGGWREHVAAKPANHIHRFHLTDMDADGYADIVFAEQHQSPERRVVARRYPPPPLGQ